jgi:diadenosine tetraphosphate (Ap4A) HIT family hydrolase
MDEVRRVCVGLQELLSPDKINVAALGNVVPQLHIHHVVRYRDDAAWPAPVWGRVPARPYTPEGLAAVIETLRQGLRDNFEYF